MNAIASIGRGVLERIEGMGAAFILLLQTLLVWPKPKNFGLFVKQLFHVGVLSLLIIMVSGLFLGMVLGLQSYSVLVKFGSTSAVGTFTGLSLVRELGPVITALLFAGRACSALTAEIGLMKQSEQLASMEMIGVDPIRQIISPRFWAGVVSMPILAVVLTMVGIMGGKLVAVDLLGVYEGSFWSNMQANMEFGKDILGGVVIKSLAFGFVCTWIAVYQGYASHPTPEGIALATTRTVVYSSLCILGLDFVLTAVMFGGLN